MKGMASKELQKQVQSLCVINFFARDGTLLWVGFCHCIGPTEIIVFTWREHVQV